MVSKEQAGTRRSGSPAVCTVFFFGPQRSRYASFPMKRVPEDTLIGSQPAQPGLSRQNQRIIAERSFRRPHALRGAAENSFMGLQCSIDLLLRILRVSIGIGRKDDRGQRFLCSAQIAEKRENRMIIWGDGQFDRVRF